MALRLPTTASEVMIMLIAYGEQGKLGDFIWQLENHGTHVTCKGINIRFKQPVKVEDPHKVSVPGAIFGPNGLLIRGD